VIRVTRLNGKEFVLNCELIKFIEATPDTIVTLESGEKFMVRESVDDLIERTVRYRQRIYRDSPGSPRSD
jgi:flagellar protein FlbD